MFLVRVDKAKLLKILYKPLTLLIVQQLYQVLIISNFKIYHGIFKNFNLLFINQKTSAQYVLSWVLVYENTFRLSTRTPLGYFSTSRGGPQNKLK